MKKSMLCAGLMTILSATVYAEDSSKSMNVNTGQTMSGPANAQSDSAVLQEAENVIADTVHASSDANPQQFKDHSTTIQQPASGKKPAGTKPAGTTPRMPTEKELSIPGKSSSLAKPYKKQELARAERKTIKASRHASAASTTAVPAATTATPAAGTTAPASSTATPAAGTTTPASSTATPAASTTKPASNTATPA
ncbi:hypothetical protein Lnau_0669, partial [Legionella nautarum]